MCIIYVSVHVHVNAVCQEARRGRCITWSWKQLCADGLGCWDWTWVLWKSCMCSYPSLCSDFLYFATCLAVFPRSRSLVFVNTNYLCWTIELLSLKNLPSEVVQLSSGQSLWRLHRTGSLIALQEIILGSSPGRVGYCLSVRQTTTDSTKTWTTLFVLTWKVWQNWVKGRSRRQESVPLMMLVRCLGVLIHAATRIYEDALLASFLESCPRNCHWRTLLGRWKASGTFVVDVSLMFCLISFQLDTSEEKKKWWSWDFVYVEEGVGFCPLFQVGWTIELLVKTPSAFSPRQAFW